MASITVKIQSAIQNSQRYHVDTQQGATLHIHAQPGVKYQLIDDLTGLGPKHIVVKRKGNDLLISFEEDGINSPDIIIENYYEDVTHAGDVVGQLDNGAFESYLPANQDMAVSIAELDPEVVAVQVLSTVTSAPALFSAGVGLLITSLTLGGVALAIGSSGGGSHKSSQPVQPDNSANPPSDNPQPLPNHPPTVYLNPQSSVNDATPLVSGTADPGVRIEVKIGDQTYTTTADAQGNWVVEVQDGLPEGKSDITVTATDDKGNTQVINASVMVDTQAPEVSVNPVDTHNAMPILSGQGEAGDQIQVIVDGKTYTTTVDASGHWSVQVDSALPEGNNTVVVKATDAAGNTTTTSRDIEIDTQAPKLNVTPLSKGNDATPVVTGTSEAGAHIEVKVGDKTYSTTADNQGNWSIELTQALPDGSNQLIVIATDDEGNARTEPLTIEVDTHQPEVTIAESVPTSNDKPTISGTGEKGDTIQVEVSGKTYTTTVDASGHWSVEVDTPLPDGQNPVTVHASDALGNTNTTSRDITIDTQAPKLTVTPLNTINTNQPTISGTAEPFANIQVEVAPEVYLTTRADDKGIWFIPMSTPEGGTTPAPLTEGSHTLNVIASDAAGNKTPSTLTVMVDTLAPDLTPTPLAISSDNTPELTGFAEAGADIEVKVGDKIYTTTANAQRQWSVELASPLPEGKTDNILITARDAAGNKTEETISIDVDTEAPPLTVETPAVSHSTTTSLSGKGEAGKTVDVEVNGQHYKAQVSPENTWSVEGINIAKDGTYPVTVTSSDKAGNVSKQSTFLSIATDAPHATIDPITLTNSPTPTITGKADRGAHIDVIVGGKTYSATAGEDGTWSITVDQALTDGLKDIVLTASDINGNTQKVDTQMTVDTSLPLMTIDPKTLTKDTTPIISGTAEKGAQVAVTIDGKTYNTTAKTDSTWSIELSQPLTDNTYEIRAVATDAAGNTNTKVSSLKIDTKGPSVAVNTLTASKEADPVISGKAEAGATVAVTVDGHVYTTTADTSGKWSIPADQGLEKDGLYDIKVTATDSAGNSTTTTSQLEIDRAAPSLTVASPKPTNDKTPIIQGAGEPNAYIDVKVGGQTYTTQVKPDGSWSLEVTAPFAQDGTYPVEIVARDAAGNTKVENRTLTIDTQAPTLTVNDPGRTNDNTPVISGKGEPGALVELQVGDKKYIGTVGSDGIWSVEVKDPFVNDGTYPIKVVTSDAAGNVTSSTVNVMVDTQDPSVVVKPLGKTNDTNPTLGTSGDNTPTFSGTAEIGATVEISLNGQTYSTKTDDKGVWSIEVKEPLSDKTYPVSIKGTDLAGNTKTITTNLTIDTSKPNLQVADIGTTNDTTPVIKGTAEAGSTVDVTINGVTYHQVVGTDEQWSVEVGTALKDGNYPIKVVATDIAGNTNTIEDKEVRIDTSAPTFEVNTVTPPSDATPTVSGKAQAGAIISVQVGDATYTGKADDKGNWSVDITDTLSDGNHDVIITASDALGNQSEPETQTLHIDTTGPAFAITPIGAPTSDKQPTFSGTTEADSQVFVTIGDKTYQAVVTTDATTGKTSWSLEWPEVLSDDTYTYSVTAKDALNNASPAQTGTVTIDSSTPKIRIDELSDANHIIGAQEAGKGLTVIGTVEDIEAGQTITVTISGKTGSTPLQGTTTEVVNGQWQVVFADGALQDIVKEAESLSIVASVKDKAGNTATSSPVSLGVDMQIAPTALSSSTLTNSETPRVSGTAEAGAKVVVTVGGHEYTTYADAKGQWSVDATLGGLTEGNNSVKVVATDAAGNTSGTDGNIQLDTQISKPQINPLLPTKDVTPEISGKTDPDTTITVIVGNQEYPAIVDNEGNWHIEAAKGGLVEGKNAITVIAKDNAGNTSEEKGFITLDTGISQPTIDKLNPSNSDAPVITGKAEAGSTVQVTVGEHTYTETADSNGDWRITADQSTWTEGSNLIHVVATDAAGNTNQNNGSIFIDKQTVQPTINPLSPTNPTKAGTPTISGTAEAGATVEVTVGGHTYTETADSNGNWSISANQSTWAEGPNPIHVEATDKAGNVQENSGSITIDTQTVQPTINPLSATKETAPTISGTAEAGATVAVTVGRHTYTETADGNGNWSITADQSTWTEGPNPIHVEATDKAGNVQENSGSITIDTQTAQPTINPLSATKETAPTISGTAEAGATVEVTVGGAYL